MRILTFLPIFSSTLIYLGIIMVCPEGSKSSHLAARHSILKNNEPTMSMHQEPAPYTVTWTHQSEIDGGNEESSPQTQDADTDVRRSNNGELRQTKLEHKVSNSLNDVLEIKESKSRDTLGGKRELLEDTDQIAVDTYEKSKTIQGIPEVTREILENTPELAVDLHEEKACEILEKTHEIPGGTKDEKEEAFDTNFSLLYTSSRDTVSNYQLQFAKPIPSWLRGTYMHNGPGQFEMGPRNLTHIYDGFAKLNKVTFHGNGRATFSDRFVETDFYKASLKENTVAPYLLFDHTQPPFSIPEAIISFFRGIDNQNINVYRLGKKLLVLSDFWQMYAIDPQTLDTVQKIDPPVPGSAQWHSMVPFPLPSTAHPEPEYNSNNFISYVTVVNPVPWALSAIRIVRITSAVERELIAVINRDFNQLPYMHSFALSQNYAVLFAHPLYIDFGKLIRTGGCSIEAVVWHPDLLTDVYVIHIHSGKVTKLQTDPMMFIHHVNSYEEGNSIIVDFITYRDPGVMMNYTQLFLRDPGKRDTIDTMSFVRRFTIDLAKRSVSYQDATETPGVEFASHFDMPVLNEYKRHHKHCYVYGMAPKIDGHHVARNALVKKDMCHSNNDRAWFIPSHYVSEPYFIAKPGGTQEDDGVLLCIVLDGTKKLSYLAIFNAQTLVLENSAPLPHTIPFLLHGRFFDEDPHSDPDTSTF